MSAAADHYCFTVGLVVRQHLVHSAPQVLHVLEATRAVGVDHKQPLPARMHHAVLDRAALALVVREADDADLDRAPARLLSVRPRHL